MVYLKKRKFPTNEKTFMLKFLARLKTKSPEELWWFKVHGEPMQVRGIPDVLICYAGLFFCIEFKIKRHGKIAITPYQQYTIDCISKASGISVIVWHDEDTGEIGVGLRKFSDIDEAIKWLIDVLGSALKVPCCNRELKE